MEMELTKNYDIYGIKCGGKGAVYKQGLTS